MRFAAELTNGRRYLEKQINSQPPRPDPQWGPWELEIGNWELRKWELEILY